MQDNPYVLATSFLITSTCTLNRDFTVHKVWVLIQFLCF